jgi:hypothetical protein
VFIVLTIVLPDAPYGLGTCRRQVLVLASVYQAGRFSYPVAASSRLFAALRQTAAVTAAVPQVAAASWNPVASLHQDDQGQSAALFELAP